MWVRFVLGRKKVSNPNPYKALLYPSLPFDLWAIWHIAQIGRVPRSLNWDRLLGGRAYLISCTLAKNGLSVTTADALVDTGANGYLFINWRLVKKMEKFLGVRIKTYPATREIGGYNGSGRQEVDTLIKFDLDATRDFLSFLHIGKVLMPTLTACSASKIQLQEYESVRAPRPP